MRPLLRVVGLMMFALLAAAPAATASPGTSAGALPPVTISPTQVRPGASFVVSGSHCFPPPGTEAFFEVEAQGQGVGFGGGGDGVPGGHWSIGLRVPAHTPPGILRITAKCDLATGVVRYPPAQVLVEPAHAPALALSADRVAAGGRLTVRASGFFGLEHVAIALRGAAPLAVVTTNRNGAATARIRLPGSTPAGPAHIDATGRTSNRSASAPLTVSGVPAPCAATGCGPAPPPLADTGTASTQQVLVGAGLLALGVLFLVAERVVRR